jgi:hypothetical protein
MKERLRSRPTPRGWGRFSTRAGAVAGAAGGGYGRKGAMDSQTRHDFLVMAIATAVTLALVAVCTMAFAVVSQLH